MRQRGGSVCVREVCEAERRVVCVCEGGGSRCVGREMSRNGIHEKLSMKRST